MGIAAAKRLSKKGILLLTDIVSDGMERVAAELGSQGVTVETAISDVTDKGSIQSLADTVSSLGRLAGLVHTAGISPTMSNWKKMFEVDLIGTALLLEGFLPLAEDGTAAVCVASMSAHMVPADPEVDLILSDPMSPDLLEKMEPHLPAENTAGYAYALAKRGVILLCKNMAPAWGARGARVVSISPGIIDTPMGRKELEENAMMKYLLEQSPLKRMGKPEDIASAVAFLLSENASFMTGTDMLVDGGVVAAIMRAK